MLFFCLNEVTDCDWVCRFGNRVLNPLSQAAFGAEGSGPGTLTASVVRASDAELAVHYSADVAGRYSLVVRCSSTGEVCKRQHSDLEDVVTTCPEL